MLEINDSGTIHEKLAPQYELPWEKEAYKYNPFELEQIKQYP